MVRFARKPSDLIAGDRKTPVSLASKPRSILKPKSPSESKQAILWCSINRDDVTVARVLTNPQHPLAPRLAQQVLKAQSTAGWEFFAFGEDDRKPGFRGCKFHLHQRNPFPKGKEVAIRGYDDERINGKIVRVKGYSPSTDEYLVQTASGQTTPISSEYIVGQAGRENIVWSFVCIYNNRLITQASVCSFLEKLAMLSEGFLPEWVHGQRLCGQDLFGEIMSNQVQFFDALGKDAFHDESLEYAKSIMASNLELMSEGSF